MKQKLAVIKLGMILLLACNVATAQKDIIVAENETGNYGLAKANKYYT